MVSVNPWSGDRHTQLRDRREAQAAADLNPCHHQSPVGCLCQREAGHTAGVHRHDSKTTTTTWTEGRTLA
jgi:hypothetical protein